MDEFLKKQLTNDQDRNFAMDELMRNSVELEQLSKKRKSLENKRVQLILKCRSHDVSLATIGNLAGISRQRVTQILEKEEITRRLGLALPKPEPVKPEWDSTEFDRLNAEYEAARAAQADEL